MSGLTILRQSWQTKTQFLFSWIRILNRVSCWREHWWHDFITRTWIPILHLSFHSWEMRSEKPLESLSPTIPSLSDPSWDRVRVSAFTVQTRIDTRWVDLPSIVSVNLSLICLNDVFHSFETIIESQGLGGSSMLVIEEEGVHITLTVIFSFMTFETRSSSLS